jgi:sigma-E factor negative regulatory protein RseA
MDKMDTRELISALADGELQGEAFAQGMELAAADPAARQAWHTYHLIGEVLRSGPCPQVTPADEFLARLRQRLDDEPPLSGFGTSVVPAAPEAPFVAPAREAANEGLFRWKMVAGVASVAAMAAVGWGLIAAGGTPPVAGQVAGAAPAINAVTRADSGVMIRDPQLDELLAAHRQLGGGSALQTPAGFLRNATFDASGR